MVFDASILSAHYPATGALWYAFANEFLKEAEEYQIDFNYRRFNTYRKGTPLELLRQRNTNVD